MRPIGIAICFVLASSLQLIAEDSLSKDVQRWLAGLEEQIPLLEDNTTAIATVIKTLAATDHQTKALRMALSQRDEDTKHLLLVDLVETLAVEGDFEQAIAAAKEIGDMGVRERATHFIGMGYARAGEIQRADSLVSKMKRDYNKDRVLTEISRFLAVSGRFDDALARCREIATPHQRRKAIQIVERLRDKKPSPLEQLENPLRSRIHLMTTFSAGGTYDTAILAIVAARRGERAEAKRLINESLGKLEKPGIPPKNLPTVILAVVAFVELGDTEGAGEIIQKIYENSDRDWSRLSLGFGTPLLMSTLVRLERLDVVAEILEAERKKFESDTDSFTHVFALSSAAESLVEHGFVREFETHLNEAVSPEERAYLLIGALNGASVLSENNDLPR